MPGIHKSPTSTTNKPDKQMIRFQKLILPILAGLLSACGQPQCVITPRPEHFERKCGYFLCDSARVAEGEIPGLIRTIDTAAEGLRAEGYRLLVTRKGISLTARDSAGLFYGEQSLRQLASAKGIPCVEITDNPRFAYRGMHLDVSRHFFPKEQVFKILDEMARYKLNKFHFHLTDNGGWRIQIDKYPLLTRLGSHRMEIDWLKWWDFGDKHYVPEGTPGAYGGYFTKEEIRQIVAYAAERHIEVIPEIEFPAHSDEVFVGYPELCCTGKPYTTGEFCVGNPATLQFAKDVLTEIMELFPSKYIHIGGDEARKIAWKSCPKCQRLAREVGGLEAVQCYLVESLEQFLVEHGRAMMGWDEILKNNLRSSSVPISYRGQRGGIEGANRGLNVVMSPGEMIYFDWYQADPYTQPRAMSGYAPIKKVYSFYPVPDTPEKAASNESFIKGEYVDPGSVEYIYNGASKYVLGVQGCMWTEFVDTKEHLEYMMFPRMLAVAEIAWTPQSLRDWHDFRRRVNQEIPRLRARGINAFQLSNDVEISVTRLPDGKKALVTLDTEKYPLEVRFTLDGTDPTPESPLYRKPFKVKIGTTVSAASFDATRNPGNIARVDVNGHHDIQNYYPYLETPEIHASIEP